MNSELAPRARTAPGWLRIARIALAVWVVLLVFVPDPKPLGAPEWAVGLVRQILGVSEPSARAVATLGLRSVSLGLLGALVMLSVGGPRWGKRTWVAILLAPLLAYLVLWLNYGYFPIRTQLQIGGVAAVLGALAGLALRRNRVAAVSFVAVFGGLFLWGTSTGIDDELDHAARLVGRHVLAEAESVPEGDAGFLALLEIAFRYAAEHSRGSDPVLPNRAAILALGVIVGDEKVADVAKRLVDPQRLPEVRDLRKRLTAHGRSDWPRHFWVSAGLTLLSDADRSITIGLTKELMDATPGGSGFSFPDLAVDAAGNRFTLAATRDAASARAMQEFILAGASVGDFMPDVHDLPEGMTREVFQRAYGGLGGAETGRIVDDIRARLDACSALE